LDASLTSLETSLNSSSGYSMDTSLTSLETSLNSSSGFLDSSFNTLDQPGSRKKEERQRKRDQAEEEHKRKREERRQKRVEAKKTSTVEGRTLAGSELLRSVEWKQL
jgi:hypothetical protein